MILTFLGTGAANGYPEAFCRCHNCERARELGGTSLRKRSAALIDDDLLIDLGPDIETASAMHGCPLTNVRWCLQTHGHSDHLDPSLLLSRSPEFGVVGAPRLHWYASRATVRRASELFQTIYSPGSLLDPKAAEHLNFEVHPIEAMQPFVLGPYRVIAFPANHDPAVDPLLYSIEADGRAIFYGIDTATLPEETWQAFHRFQVRFNIVILDHTFGLGEHGSDHLGAREFVEHVERMRQEGLLADGARAFATHISHPGNPVHPELANYAVQHGYEVAYDGLTV